MNNLIFHPRDEYANIVDRDNFLSNSNRQISSMVESISSRDGLVSSYRKVLSSEDRICGRDHRNYIYHIFSTPSIEEQDVYESESYLLKSGKRIFVIYGIERVEAYDWSLGPQDVLRLTIQLPRASSEVIQTKDLRKMLLKERLIDGQKSRMYKKNHAFGYTGEFLNLEILGMFCGIRGHYLGEPCMETNYNDFV